MIKKKLLSLILLVWLSTGVASLQAAGNAQQRINSKLHDIASLWPKKNAQAVVDSVYTEQTEITGEGVEELYKGKKQLADLVTHLMEGSKSTTIHLDRLVQLSENSAYTWVTWNVAPAGDEAPFKMKSLFVWKKEQGDWFIVADMFASGAIPN